ncbi:phage tail protein [Sphingobacterium hotanense]|uniref:Phage tail protein n=1 Tax=Sphingobacterium hotanense TaxID=649196 RepID=A0ABT7NLP9_9SPHI|nr:phage tail protein [Sphingobacterium hotanense]MDM1048065.1 phage tail protein [Sphingobacterium hotanense]
MVISQVYRKNIDTIKLSLEHAEYVNRLMGEHQLVFNITSSTVLDIRIGDYVRYKGEKMIINSDPDYKKVSNKEHSYVITFEGERHSLRHYYLQDEGDMNFDYTDNLLGFMNMFLECLNMFDPDWTLGEIEDLEPQTITFDKQDCLSALNMISETFNCEWQIRGKVLNVKKNVGLLKNISVSYGKNNGLYELTRKKLENGSIITRAYAFGGVKNLPQSYPYKELRLPDFIEDQAAVELYGVREGYVKDEKIFPNRTGIVSNVSRISENKFSVTDNNLDFNIKDHLIDGTEARIIFKSGALNGHDFKIIDYNHSTKTIIYEPNIDSNSNMIPFGTFDAEIGDTYTLTGIRMPQVYVDEALSSLVELRKRFLEDNKVPRVIYDLTFDVLFLKRNSIELNEGDIIKIEDDGIGLNSEIRINSVRYTASFPEFLVPGMKYSVEIGNEVTYTRIQKIEKDIRENVQIVSQTVKRNDEQERISALRLRQLQQLTFDPDGYFNGERIKPESIETMMLSVGARSQNFYLDGIRIVPNFANDENAISITPGKLIHREIQINGLGYIWLIDEFTRKGLDPLKSYYLSIKCSKTSLTGQWHLSDVPLKTEEESGFYHFNCGVLYSVLEGRRDYAFTNGMTYINGNSIQTGKVAAQFIDVVGLFAQNIEATNLKVTGNSMIGDFEIDAEGLKYFYSQTAGNSTLFRVNYGNLIWEQLVSKPGIGTGTAKFKAGSPGTNEGIVNVESTENHPANKGIKINMLGTNKRAIEVNKGLSYFGDDIALDPDNTDILIGGKSGLSGTYEYNRGGGIWELEFEKGILVGQRLVSS